MSSRVSKATMKIDEDDLGARSWHRRTHLEEGQNAPRQFESASLA